MQTPFTDQNAYGARSLDPRFGHPRYTIKKKLLQLLGATFYLYDPNEQLVLWGAQKAFKLKEDLRLYTDDTKTHELIRIAARSIIDFSSAYDVYDSATNQKVGAFKRQGLKSAFMQDTWVLMDVNDREVGLLQEDSAFLGLVRRFIEYTTYFLPQKYTVTLNNVTVATYARTKNPFSSKLEIDFSMDAAGAFDRRLGLAMAMLLEAIEGKQR